MQILLDGSNRVDLAIERLRAFEPREGYILCFSGGKDSTVLKALADIAGVKYEAHYHVTTIDPPPVLRFMRQHHPDVRFDPPTKRRSFAQAIGEMGFPLRHTRWCCKEFKERKFPGRLLLLGIRKAERRASAAKPGQRSSSGLVRFCQRTGARAVQPIFDWSDGEVWSFIKSRGLPYCSLYDEGWLRIGCICCPFASRAAIQRNRERWPAMFRAILRGFEQRWETHWRHRSDIVLRFRDARALFEAWLCKNATFAYQKPVKDLWTDT